MADFPSIPSADFGTEEEVYKPQIRTEFEAGYVQSRPRTTREIRRFPLSWSVLSEADYQTLETFFKANQGNSFNWTHPVTAAAYVCRFSTDSLKSVWIGPGYRAVQCPIEVV